MKSEETQSVVLRLPLSLRARAEQMAHAEHVSLNFFVASALADLVAKLERKHLNNEEKDGPAQV